MERLPDVLRSDAWKLFSELEKEKRGLYTGSLGYWDPLQDQAVLNILIRTIILK